MVRLISLLASFLAVMVVITIHEFSHAFIAYKCGDPTAKMQGRMTLNPAKHFDLLGILMFALVGFGWAKPVPINPDNFKKFRSGAFWTSAAGIFANIISAFLFFPLYILVGTYIIPLVDGLYASIFLHELFSDLYIYSLSFAVFNLLPFNPLDGFRMIDALNRKQGKVYRFLRDKGYYVLLTLIFIHYLVDFIPALYFIDILGFVLTFVNGILMWPIFTFWFWIFSL